MGVRQLNSLWSNNIIYTFRNLCCFGRSMESNISKRWNVVKRWVCALWILKTKTFCFHLESETFKSRWQESHGNRPTFVKDYIKLLSRRNKFSWASTVTFQCHTLLRYLILYEVSYTFTHDTFKYIQGIHLMSMCIPRNQTHNVY